MMAWIHRQEKANGGVFYRVRWREGGKCRAMTAGTNKAAALELAAEKSFEMSQRAQAARRGRWGNFVMADLKHVASSRAEKTLELVERTYRMFNEWCGPMFLSEIDFAMLERFRTARLAGGLAPATVNGDLRNLRAGLYRAKRRGLIDKSPFEGQTQALFLTEAEPVPVSLEATEVMDLLDACPTPTWKGIVLCAYYAGLRLGELLALDWGDVDFRRNMIHVRNKRSHRTKSGKNRAIVLHETLKKSLWALRVDRVSRESEKVFAWTSRRAGRKSHVAAMSSAFAQICREAGLVDADGRHKYTLHDLRRTCITEWLRGGLDIANVKEMAGHEDLKTTLRHYAAVKSEIQAAAARKR